MRRLFVGTMVIAVAGLLSAARADDKVDPSGTWKWKAGQAGQEREVTLKLKLEGDKLTGSILGRNNEEMPIEEAKFQDGQISFKFVRERNGQKFASKYAGKVSKDSIKGKTEVERDGQTRSREWEAKRAS